MLTQLKITVRKKESWKRTLILKWVTRVQIFFLDCSTISKNSENGDIFHWENNQTSINPPTVGDNDKLLLTQNSIDDYSE